MKAQKGNPADCPLGTCPVILEPDSPPSTALATAVSLLSDCLDERGMEGARIGSLAIPVHRLRQSPDGGWDSVVPLVGWAFPVFLPDLETLTHLVWVWADPEPLDEGMVSAAEGRQGDVADAFAVAWGVGLGMREDCRLRLVDAPGVMRAFWLHAGTRDAFVEVEGARVLSGPGFVSLLRGPYWDMMRDAEGAAG